MLKLIKHKLIVSVQALEDEPLHGSFIMGRMALAVKQGGAVAIRAQGVEDIVEIKKVTQLPVIGIIKRNYEDSEVFITPTKKEVLQLLDSKCEMIALDATKRKRPNQESLKELIDLIKQNNVLVMADISTYDEALHAQKLDVDCVSTTLCGYTPYSDNYDHPDYKLIQRLINDLTIPLIVEGKINSPEELKKVMDLGAHSAVVGGAITRPQLITKKFSEVLE